MTMELERSGTSRIEMLRLWPGIVAAVVIVIGLVLGLLFTIAIPDVAAVGLLASIVGTLVVFVWWLFFSRARWFERLAAMARLIAAWIGRRPFLDKSIIGGAMGGLPFVAFTVFAVALVAWATATQNFSHRGRVVWIIPAMLIAAVLCTVVKTSGIRGGRFEPHGRLTPTPQERLLAESHDEVVTPPTPATPTALTETAPAKANADLSAT